MCGRVIQSSGPLRYAIVDGMNVRDSRVHNYPPRWNAAPSQELLVIRRNHKSGEVSLDPLRWGLIPSWAKDKKMGAGMINARAVTLLLSVVASAACRRTSDADAAEIRAVDSGAPSFPSIRSSPSRKSASEVAKVLA
jgi:putative SOS response-associated peptidase YedK